MRSNPINLILRSSCLSITLLFLAFSSFSQVSTDQSGIKTTVINSLSANGAQPLRYEILALGYNSYHWQYGGIIIVELFHKLYSTGYERYIIDNGYGRGANSGTALAKLTESHGIMHNAKISLGTPTNLTTSLGGEINKVLPVYLDIREYSEYKVRITYMQDKVDVITTYNQIKINATPAGVVVPDFYGPTVLDNDLSSSGNLMVSGAGNHYIENGNVGIGTKSPKERLSVNGKIRAHEIKVETANWPDYVFAKNYNLPALQSVEKHIKEEGYLPDMPSAKEVESNGINVGEMNAKLLKKIEELTLYLIDLDKKVNKLSTENKELKGLLSNNKLKEIK